MVQWRGMRLYKRGGVWWCSYAEHGETVRRSTKCATKDAADLIAKRWERERADPDHAAAQAATFEGACKGFLRDLDRSDTPATTRLFYRAKVGVLARILGSDTPLSDVNAAAVDCYIAAREAEPVAWDEKGAPSRWVTAYTISKELTALRQVLKRARRRGELRRDVDEIMPARFSPKYQPRKLALSQEHAAALVRQLAPSRAAVVAFVLATGARSSEVFAARREDIDGVRVRLRGTKTEGSAVVVMWRPPCESSWRSR